LAGDPWKRALVGMVLLVLLMLAASFLSHRLRGGRGAFEALSSGEETAGMDSREGGGAAEASARVGPADPVGAETEGEASFTTPVVSAGSPSPGSARGEGMGEVWANNAQGAPDGHAAAVGARSSPPVELAAVPGDDGDDVTGEGSPASASTVTSPGEESGRGTTSPGTSTFGDLGSALLRVFLGLAAVVALILALRRLSSKRGRKVSLVVGEGRLEVLGFTPLGPSSGIYEVRAGSKVLLVGMAEGSISLLGEMDVEELVTAEEAELLEDEFLSLLREEMSRPHPATGKERRSLMDELRWRTSRTSYRRKP
jgi:flagellar biogenesis protein FliO